MFTPPNLWSFRNEWVNKRAFLWPKHELKVYKPNLWTLKDQCLSFLILTEERERPWWDRKEDVRSKVHREVRRLVQTRSRRVSLRPRNDILNGGPYLFPRNLLKLDIRVLISISFRSWTVLPLNSILVLLRFLSPNLSLLGLTYRTEVGQTTHSDLTLNKGVHFV